MADPALYLLLLTRGSAGPGTGIDASAVGIVVASLELHRFFRRASRCRYSAFLRTMSEVTLTRNEPYNNRNRAHLLMVAAGDDMRISTTVCAQPASENGVT